MKRNSISRIIYAALFCLISFCGTSRAQEMNLEQTLSDQAQRTTLAFSSLAMMTGNLYSQSFYPPGKVADYTGFQYLRDNDPDGMGHNTSFLTRVAENVIYILTDAQITQLANLAVAQEEQFNLYGYKRYPLMKAFRRLMEGDVPTGATGLSLTAVKQASKELYLLDGQISFDRALLYANILNALDSTQKAYLASMKGKGWNSWPDTSTTEYQAVLKVKMQKLPQGSAVLVMTYAGDLFSWYAGSIEADVYFCPERQGTYYGGFYMKDAPAMGHEGYSISTELTATAGSALSDSSQGYVTAAQAASMSSLVDTQRNNLYAGTSSIVSMRTQIATLLRGLLTSTASSDSIKSQVLSLSGTYGELDGENNYYYATVFAQVYKTLSDAQKTKLADLRKSIMAGTYSDGTPFDFTTCTTPYLYSSEIKDTSTLDPYISDTDYLFDISDGSFTLTSSVGVECGTLPIDYTYDGSGASPTLSWSNAPAGTKEFAVLMTTLPGDSTTKWNWILYNIPATAAGIEKNNMTVGTVGMNSDTGVAEYAPPQSKGPGDKLYTFTIYALSASPSLPASPELVTGDVLTSAISSITLDSASLNLSYARTGPVAAFTYAQDAGGSVVFTNASGLSTSSWAWNFGDKTTSKDQNPIHTYSADGSFTVTLTVSNSFGSNTTTKTISITGSNRDSEAPEITSFTVPANVNTLSIPISSFTVTDNVAATAYMITLTSTPPAATAATWTATKPATFPVPSTGTKTLYAWAKDAAGNVSSVKSATCIVDMTKPVLSTFTVPSISNGKTVTGITLTATDNVAVSAYQITESAVAPDAASANWKTPAPTTYVFDNAALDGSKSLYAWAKDAAGNVSLAKSAILILDTTAPEISSFTVPATVKTMSVPITSFTASDNRAVTGYMITLTSTPPLSSAATWSAVKPTSFPASSSGVKTLYAWVKDSAGNISAPATATVSIDFMTTPVISAFTVQSPVNSLTTPVTSFTVADTNSVNGYLITAASTVPAATLAAWKTEKPTSYTVTRAGTKTLYAWAKNTAGTVSSAKTAICIVDMTKPVVSTFTVPSLSKSKTVTGIVIKASDNVAVAAYHITESSVAPDAASANWRTTAPTTYVIDSLVTDGSKILYAWAKDTAGNVSLAKSATLTLDTTAPQITAFTVPAIVKTLSVPITSFTASDNRAVTGYMITLTSTPPLSTATTWKTSKPTIFSAPSEGVKALYAWVKDSSGNVSAPSTATVNIDMTAPVIRTFTIQSPANSLTIPILSLNVIDATGVNGYLITTTSTVPAATLATWKTEKPTSYTVTSAGTKTLHAWAKDAAGNVSSANTASCVVDMTKPVITTFTVPSISKSKTVTGITIKVTDNVAVAAYQITESPAAPDAASANWKNSIPTTYVFDSAATGGLKTLYAWAKDMAGNVSLAKSATCTLDISITPAFNMEQSISEGAQRTTLAFAGLAMVTGNLEAQSFFPPGKVADYTGFQYLRDNDPDNMGHNTSFLTRVAENVIYMLNDAQIAQLSELAVAQEEQFNLYAYKRYPLMTAFRRLLEGDIPAGSLGLNLNAVKNASRELYEIDGQISFDRALLYANVLNSMDAVQKAYLASMKGKGWNSWPDTYTTEYQAIIKARMQSLPKGSAVLVMTYASDLFSWYAGSVEADTYFCPERHGTYYGSFYIKDAPAIGHEGYGIDEQLTATAGAALCDSTKGYVTPDQASLISRLVDAQMDNLYAGTSNIVEIRTQIATLLRSLMTSTASSDSVRVRVLELSSIYGELDGENNYHYANAFAEFYNTLSVYQKTQLVALRKSIMSGVYSDGTPFDFSVCETPFLYSSVITDLSLLDPYIDNTNYLFFEP